MDTGELSGRALDAAIARDLFGLEGEERSNIRTKAPDWVCREPGRQWLRVAFYSASLTASLNVQLALQARGWKHRDRHTGAHRNEPGVVRVVLEHADGRTVEATGTPDEALCRAALKTVERA